jgi:hypothetical protein
MLSIVLPLLIAAAGAVATPSPYAVLESPVRHVRATEPYVDKLLRSGFERSATFARLLADLDQTDVIVHIELVPQLPGALEGRMLMMPRAHDYRYVRIQVALCGSPDETIAIIGHELRHATEVATASDVNTLPDLRRLYERIGIRGGPELYDTRAAQETGRQVRKELT